MLCVKGMKFEMMSKGVKLNMEYLFGKLCN